jgi:putative oxidoreductase
VDAPLLFGDEEKEGYIMEQKSIFMKPFTSSSAALLIPRFVLGVIFFAHGAQKVLGWFGGYGLSATVNAFDQMLGIPTSLAYLASFTEFLGGIAMLLGVLSRIFAAGLTINMVVAAALVHLPNGFFLSSAPGQANGFEYNLALIALSLVVFILGPGDYSLDRVLFAHRMKGEQSHGEARLAAQHR